MLVYKICNACPCCNSKKPGNFLDSLGEKCPCKSTYGKNRSFINHHICKIKSLDFSADKILYGNSEIKSGKAAFNFTVPVELTVVKGNKRTKFTVYIMTLNTGLPSMSITTNDNQDILSKTGEMKDNFKLLLKDGTTKTVTVEL